MWPLHDQTLQPTPANDDVEKGTSSGPVPIPSTRESDAWRTVGYPSFSRWMASHDDFMALRRFGALNTRILLLLQNDITKAERRIAEYDEEAKTLPDLKGRSDCISDDPFEDRLLALRELVPLMERYNSYLVTYSQIRNMPAASDRQIKNIQGWLDDEKHMDAIFKPEQEFVQKGKDVVSLVSDSRSPMLEFLRERCPHFISKLFPAKLSPEKDDSPSNDYTNEAAVESVASALYVLAGLGLLFGPMWWLAFVSNTIKRLGIITGFVAFFTAIVFKGSDLAPWEVVGASAAYAAVLLVYLPLTA